MLITDIILQLLQKDRNERNVYINKSLYSYDLLRPMAILSDVMV